jgi:hypothetical protein
MPVLTRRRDHDRADCWHVHFGDVRVGQLARRSGIPIDEDPWEWICGFYPGSEPGEYLSGTAATFDQARADFDPAWRIFSAKRTEADYQAWLDDRDWHARKRAMWAAGAIRIPYSKRSALSRKCL